MHSDYDFILGMSQESAWRKAASPSRAIRAARAEELFSLAVYNQDINVLFIRHIQSGTEICLIQIKRDRAFTRLSGREYRLACLR